MKKSKEDLRSYRWFGRDDLRSFGHRSRAKQMGYAQEDYAGKPVIAILNTWSDLNPCHTHFRTRAEEVKRGILQRAGFPIELPAMSLSEPFVKPTTMLYRNFLAMETEELIRSHPVDGVVLMGGCDKTTPGLLMGAISVVFVGVAVYENAALAENQDVVVATAHTPPVNDGLPMPGFDITRGNTALMVTDPQNDFLSPKGSAWGVVGKSVTENGTVKNLGALFKVADETGLPVFISPHYYYPYDHRWKFEGTLEVIMHKLPMFERTDQLDVTGFKGSGSDWLEQYKPYINNGKTIVTSPHKMYGPESNDLVLQMRKAGNPGWDVGESMRGIPYENWSSRASRS